MNAMLAAFCSWAWLAAAPVQERAAPASLTVDLVTADGAPARGAPVVLLAYRAGMGEQPVATAVADRFGRATFAVADVDPELRRTRHFAVAADLPQRGRSVIDVELDRPVTPRLRLPPCGRVLVKLADRGTDALRQDAAARVVLTPTRRSEPPQGSLAAEPPPPFAAAAPLVDGRAEFLFVPLGDEFEAYAIGGGVTTHLLHFAGPRTVDAGVSEELPAVEPPPWLRGRLVDAQGHPLAARRLELALLTTTGFCGQSASYADSSDADGFFGVALHSSPVGQSPSLSIVVRTADGSLDARFHAAVPDVAGDLDLGDVAAPVATELAQGLVVDEHGQPVAGVDLALRRDPTLPIDPDVADESKAVLRAGSVVGTSGHDGRFVLRGPPVGAGFRVDFSSDLFLREPVLHMVEAPELRPGTADLRVVVAHGGAAAGRLQLADGASPEDLTVRFVASGTSALATGSVAALDLLGSFRAEGLRPATYDVVVSAGACVGLKERELVRIADVVVPAGGQADDPRLAVIDLRGRLSTLELRAATADGLRVQKGQLFVVTPGTTGGAERHEAIGWLRDGRAVLSLDADGIPAAPRAAAAIELRVEGMRPVRVPRAPGRAALVVEPGPAVRFRVSPESLPFRPSRLILTSLVDRAARVDSVLSQQQLRFDGTQEAATRVGVTGPYELVLYAFVKLPREDEERGVRLELPPDASVVTIRDDATAEQVIELRLTTAAIERAATGKSWWPPKAK